MVARLPRPIATRLNFAAEKLRRPPAPQWAERPKTGDLSLGVSGDQRWGWFVSLYKYGKATWLVETRLAGPFALEIEAVMECRDEANRRGLPRSF